MNPDLPDLDARLLAWMEQAAQRWDDGGPGEAAEAEFDRLARELFADQYERNIPYRRFCRARGAQPGRIPGWEEIPPVPLSAFKELTLSCDPPESAAAVFMTSGSTDPSRRGRNHHPHLRLYDASLQASFRHWFLPDRERIRLLVLNPPPAQQPHSSLAYFLGRLVDSFGAPGSAFFLDEDGLQVDRLSAALAEAERDGVAVGLLGTSFAYVHLLDALEASGASFALPAGSRLLDTGGFKGRSREVSAETLRAAFGDRLGIPDPWCVNYYGMTEISTQYYDTSLRRVWLGEDPGPRVKAVPPWARIRVVDPGTGRPVPAGERGLLVHVDLANRGSCLAVLAEDVGHLTADGFVLLGRAQGSEARGCSIALDELLAANGGRRR
ncbi:LuxE/PaaK family acyltransferase [Blastococcus atacamensis]|uniref:LuxE/PaaK family acyltransferase n=1 Tax=Blastococcus atacamensis TaxID=2070508 RepID=UPI000CEBDF76|nr:AMP-binding protein [Blastococcus atacamensis]